MVPLGYTGRPRPRRLYRVLGSGNGNVFGVHNDSTINVRRALMERVYNVEGRDGLEPPPQAVPGAFEELRSVRDFVVGKVRGTTRYTYEQFVACYSGRRKTIYQNAVDSLLANPVEVKDSYLSSFVKCEKINFSKKPDPAPRIIQPRHPRYNVEVGRFLRPLEHRVYDALAELWGGPTVMKGYNASEVATHIRDMWDQFQAPVAVGLDASRFDQHVGEQALRWEHSVYNACWGGSEGRELRKLLNWQVHNTGFARARDGGYKYTTTGCRMSGDMNTALGNCLIMCALVWHRCDELGIVARLANNGDDCVVVMERGDLDKFLHGLSDWFVRFGFSMKQEDPVSELEEVEFCQAHPVRCGQGWVMVRDPRVVVDKDLCTVIDVTTPSAFQRYLGAIGDCGAALSSGVPVMQEFYHGLQLASSGFRMGDALQLESGMARLASRMTASYDPVTPEARVSFYKAFGITPDAQEAAEAQLRQVDYRWSPAALRDNSRDCSLSLSS